MRHTSAGAPGPAGASASAAGALWHVLQMSDVLDLEFAAGLAEDGPVLLWKPRRSFLPRWPRGMGRASQAGHPNLKLAEFSVLRGAARLPFSVLERSGRGLLRQLRAHSAAPWQDVLVCTTPHFAAVAEGWPGPVVYWLTDLIAAYEGVSPEAHRRLDERMCRRASLVCPNSERIANYLQTRAGCPAAKLLVVPNATRARNTLGAPSATRDAAFGKHGAEMPADVPALSGPVAGVIGALGGNMDWEFLEQLQAQTPWLRWVFVGPFHLRVEEGRQRRARRAVRRHPNSTFLGPRPYGELFRYARAFTVAVLPYRRREPTFSGSSTRFYEHLAAGHPMLATPGVAELLTKEPLLRLASTAAQGAEILETWRRSGFEDGQREARWRASLAGTWTGRARAMRAALEGRLRAEAAPEPLFAG